MPRRKKFLTDVQQGLVPQTLWKYTEVGHTQDAKREIINFFGFDTFATPKPTSLIKQAITISSGSHDTILDFFAGSGTTAHAVIDLNRADGGKRTFILVEMGEYFDTVLLPRVQKALYTDAWRDGQPQADKPLHGASALVAVCDLEQYEDALNNIRFSQRSQQHAAQLRMFEDYVAEHMLVAETRQIDAERLGRDPFGYTLRVGNGNSGALVTVDAVATFVFVTGMRTRRQIREIQHGRPYVIVTGDIRDTQVIAIWRATDKLDLAADRATLRDLIARHAARATAVYINGDCLLPAELGRKLEVPLRNEAHWRVASFDAEHPALSFFADERFKLLLTEAPVYAVLGTQPLAQARVLARLDDPGKSALLLERPYLRGRVILWTSTIDNAWTRIPDSPATLVPLVHELLRYGARAEAPRRNLAPGEPLQVEVTGAFPSKLVLVTPEGARHALDGDVVQTVGGPWKLPGIPGKDTERIGAYRIESEGASAIPFAVQLDAREGDLERLPSEEAQQLSAVFLLPHGAAATIHDPSHSDRGELWRQIALACLACLCLESLWAAYLGRKRRVA